MSIDMHMFTERFIETKFQSLERNPSISTPVWDEIRKTAISALSNQAFRDSQVASEKLLLSLRRVSQPLDDTIAGEISDALLEMLFK